MSLCDKFKNIFSSGGCVIQSKDITINTVKDALNLIDEIKKNRDSIAYGAPKVLKLVEQSVHWIESIQKDMDIVKADKLRSIAHEIAAIRIQLGTMLKDIDTLKSEIKSDIYTADDKCIEKIKDTVKKIKKQKETKDDNK